MRTYLGVVRHADGDLRVAVEREPYEMLGRGAKVSPIFRADGVTADDVVLPDDCVLAFVVPTSPRAFLAALENGLGAQWLQRSYISHGLVSTVIVLNCREDWDEVERTASDLIRGYELWPTANGIVRRAHIERSVPNDRTAPSFGLVSDEGLPYESASQVRRFNALLASVAQRIAQYVPEATPMLWSLHGACVSHAENLRQLDGATGSEQARHHRLSILVEMNASLSMFSSQALAGTLPLSDSAYPSGEYSLLGIGTSVRALLRVYGHISGVFDQANLPGRIAEAYGAPGTDFEPYYFRDGSVDYDEWDNASILPASLPAAGSAELENHLTYYSSRWGFRQTHNTISVSWQCVHAAASKQWNLLTLTHEYLHAHVSQLLAASLQWTDEDDMAATETAMFNGDLRETARDSIRAVAMGAMVHLKAADSDDAEVDMPATELSAAKMNEISVSYYWYLQELGVHTLDYQYFYGGDDLVYVSSIWNSWALVPQVAKKLDHYLVRSISALSVTPMDAADMGDLFNRTVDRLETAFRHLLDLQQGEVAGAGRGLVDSESRPNPIVLEALDRLSDPDVYAKLEQVFNATSYVAKMFGTFFFEPRLHSDLLADSNIASPGRRFDLRAGEYRDEPIESPIAFLLDRFHSSPTNSGVDTSDFETLWQAIMMVEEPRDE